MKTRAQTRFGTGAVLALLSLLAFAIGAQAALAAHSSNGSAAITPAAGTEGRGGIDGSAAAVAIGTSPAAGTQDRGGASLSTVSVSPAAGTQGRGGIAAAASTLAATSAVVATAGDAFVSRARGGFPSGPTAAQGLGADSSGWPGSGGWIAAGLVAAAAVIAGFFAWAANRRRVWQQQSSLASFCAYNPRDTLCGAG